MSGSDKAALDAFGSFAISDIEVVPGYRIPEKNGVYRVSADWEAKMINGKPNLVLNMTSLEDVEDAVLKGDQWSQPFSREGMAYNRDLLEKAAALWEAETVLGLVEAGTMEVEVTLKRRADKNDPEKFYCNVTAIKAA